MTDPMITDQMIADAEAEWWNEVQVAGASTPDDRRAFMATYLSERLAS